MNTIDELKKVLLWVFEEPATLDKIIYQRNTMEFLLTSIVTKSLKVDIIDKMFNFRQTMEEDTIFKDYRLNAKLPDNITAKIIVDKSIINVNCTKNNGAVLEIAISLITREQTSRSWANDLKPNDIHSKKISIHSDNLTKKLCVSLRKLHTMASKDIG